MKAVSPLSHLFTTTQ